MIVLFFGLVSSSFCGKCERRHPQIKRGGKYIYKIIPSPINHLRWKNRCNMGLSTSGFRTLMWNDMGWMEIRAQQKRYYKISLILTRKNKIMKMFQTQWFIRSLNYILDSMYFGSVWFFFQIYYKYIRILKLKKNQYLKKNNVIFIEYLHNFCILQFDFTKLELDKWTSCFLESCP